MDGAGRSGGGALLEDGRRQGGVPLGAGWGGGALQGGKIESADEWIFVERMGAPQRLFVLGAGDDAKPLVSMAALLGWSVTVADGRAQLARVERFPEAERVMVLDGSDGLGVCSEDAVVLMTT